MAHPWHDIALPDDGELDRGAIARYRERQPR